jgi:hypothetical protein
VKEGGDTTAEPVIWPKAAVVRALRAALVSALALYVAHAAFWVGGEDLGDAVFSWVHLGLMFAAAAICLARAQRDASERAAWLCLALALGTYAGGELAWEFLYEDLQEPPYPSLSDALWLIFYPASYAGLIFLIRPRLRRFHPSLWLDGLVGALVAAALAAAVVFAPVLEATEGSPAALATTLAYPVGDMLLLGFVVGVFALTGWRPGRSWALLGAGLGLNAVADVIYTVQSAEGTFVEGSLPDTLFPAAALTLAWAALAPPQGARKLVLEGRRMFFLPAGFWLVAVGLTVLGVVGRLNGVAAALTIATLLAVMGRAWLTFRENGALLERACGLAGPRHITERAAHRIVCELVEAGYLSRQKVGRRNYYEVHPELPLRHRLEGDHEVGEVLFPLLGSSEGAKEAA